MIAAVARLLARLWTPVIGEVTAAPRAREVTPRAPVGVIDVVGSGLGDALVHQLDGAGVRAVAATAFELPAGFEAVVLIVPLDPRGLHDHGVTLLATVEQVAVDEVLRATFTAAIVTVWVVEAGDRPRHAVSMPSQNFAPVLVGTAWCRELARTGGDLTRAVARRSVAVASVVKCVARTAVAANDDTVRWLSTVDPSVIHALVCRHPRSDRPGAVIEWESVIAAVIARMAALPASPK